MNLFLGLFLILAGAFELLAPNLAWRLHAHGKRTEGLKTERTPEWDRWRTIGGFILIGGGILMLALPA